MKQVWWKVPVYCIAAGFISFQLMVHLLGRFTIVTLPDGSISTDQTRWLILSGVIFVFTVGIGGFFFRKMTRREIFCSATILVLCNIVFGLLSFKSNHILTLLLMYLSLIHISDPPVPIFPVEGEDYPLPPIHHHIYQF